MDAESFQPAVSAPFAVRARWILPVAGPPLPGGAIEVGADGTVLALHSHPPSGAHDLGDVAIVPGFVNAHTHLEFSELAEPLQPARPFSEWIRALLTYRRRRGDAERAIRAGLAESRQQGTIAVGDIDTRGEPGQYSESSLRVVAFRELLGRAPETVADQLQIGAKFLAQPAGEFPRVSRGLSPHAPYSVHPQLLEDVISLAKKRGCPLAIHLAETRAELECLAAGSGELVDFLTEAGIWRGALYPPGTRPLDLLRRFDRLRRVLIAHGNYLDDEELEFLARHPNFILVYCPRTHAFFGHQNHPWRKLAARGGIVAIGTDGRCSNPDLSIWRELQYLRQSAPDCDAEELLRMGTLNGAMAIGLESRLGTIERGKSAAMAVIRLGRVGATDLYEELFHEDSQVVNLIVL